MAAEAAASGDEHAAAQKRRLLTGRECPPVAEKAQRPDIPQQKFRHDLAFRQMELLRQMAYSRGLDGACFPGAFQKRLQQKEQVLTRGKSLH